MLNTSINRIFKLSLIGLIAFSLMGFAAHQLTVPSIEDRADALFRDFDELQRLGAYVVGEDGEKLGDISKGLGSDSLGNPYGAGNEYKSNGLFNSFGKYGGQFNATSAFNSLATKPPSILIRRNGDVYSVGLLTTNKLAPTRGQRINPYLLKAWLQSK
jgi:hypothetical protein